MKHEAHLKCEKCKKFGRAYFIRNTLSGRDWLCVKCMGDEEILLSKNAQLEMFLADNEKQFDLLKN